jgi:phage tail-like protein
VALLIIRSAQGQEERTLRPGRITIGRNPDNDLVLNAPTVSRVHAELDLRDDGLFLTDIGSSGGTFVGEARLLPNQPRRLLPGEEVRIGAYTLIYLEQLPVIDPEDPAVEPGDRVAEGSEQPAEEPVLAGPVTEGVAVVAKPPSRVERVPVNHELLPHGDNSRYLRYLPGIFHGNDFFGRYLQIFETLWEPQEWRVDHMHMYIDPRTAPAGMIDWLAGWFDLAINAHWPESRRRRLLAEAADLYRWRGTRYGMTRMIEVCADVTPDIQEDPNQPFVFRVLITIPNDREVDLGLIEDLIRAHKPAHSGYVLEVR